MKIDFQKDNQFMCAQSNNSAWRRGTLGRMYISIWIYQDKILGKY